MKNNIQLLIIFFLILSFPFVVYANAGTSLLWATSFHLIFGNFIIASGESVYLVKKYKTQSSGWVFLFLLLANYVSMGIGIVLSTYIGKIIGTDFMNPNGNFDYYLQHLLIYAGFTLGSIFIEFPLFKLSLVEASFKKAFKISLPINLVSAGVVIIVYIVFQLGGFRLLIN